MRIIDLIRVDCIKVPLHATTREAAIDELVDLLVRRHEIDTCDDSARKIKDHESTAPTDTYITGIAFPHETSHTSRRRCMAIGKPKEPIQWGKHPVSFVFLYLVPKADTTGRVEILKMLAEELRGDIIQERLNKADKVEEIYNILVRIGTDFDIPSGFNLRMVLGRHTDVIHSLSWSPDGRKLASGGAGIDQGRIWDAESGNLIALLEGHVGPIFSIKWSPDGSLLASGCSDNLIRLWDAHKFKLQQMLDSQDQVYSVSWSQDSKTLVAASHFCMARLWDCETGAPKPGLDEAYNIGYCISWSPDGRWIAAGGDRMEPSVKIWDPHTGRLEKKLAVPSGSIFTIVWSPDGTILAAGSSDGSILIYKAGTWHKENVLRGHSAQLTALDFSYNSELLVSKADDGTVRLWHRRTGNELAQLSESGGMHRLFNGIAFHPRALKLATLGEGGQSIRIWELDQEKIIRVTQEPLREKAPIPVLAPTAMTLDAKEKAGKYDVFLCHNSQDKPEVMKIGQRLKDRGILPWLDEWNVRPGLSWLNEIEKQIPNIHSAAVFVGKNDIGPWQQREVYAFIQQFVIRDCPVIPVILPDCEHPPELPTLLGDLKWVDFRIDDPDPMSGLIWGITGDRPK